MSQVSFKVSESITWQKFQDIVIEHKCKKGPILEEICTVLDIPSSPELSKSIDNFLQKISKEMQNRRKTHSGYRQPHEDTDPVVLLRESYISADNQNDEDEENENEENENENTVHKHFRELTSDKQRKRRTKDILNQLSTFIAKDAELSGDLSITELLGYLIHRINYRNNRSVASEGMKLFTRNHTERNLQQWMQ